ERDAGQADVEQLAGQLRFGRQVQVAEQQVVAAQVLQVAGDRLLDLDDHFALLVQRRRVGRDLHPEARVLLVRETALDAGALLQPLLVATLDRVTRRGGNERNAPFEGLGFLGDADTHVFLGPRIRGRNKGIMAGRLYPRPPLT